MLRFFNMSSKKGQGLPINVVILAALALVVLLVLFGILTGKIKWFGKGLSTCPGECLNQEDCANAGGFNLGSSFLAPEHQKLSYPQEGDTCSKISDNFCCSARQAKS